MPKTSFRALFYLLVFGLFFSCVGEDFIEVVPSQKPKIVIFGSSASIDSLLVGESKQYGASYINEYGLQADKGILWTSDNPIVATVDANGKVEGISRGNCQIIASSGSRSASQSLRVYSIERVEISAPRNYLFLNDSLQLSANYFDANNQIQSASFNWSSVSSIVAAIDNSGLVRAYQKGQTFITASANGIQSDPFLINVVNDSNAAASVQIIKDTGKLYIADQFQYMAEVRNGFGQIINSVLRWSSSDSTVLSIDDNGLATALKQGSTNVMASVNGVNSGLSQLVVLEGIGGSKSGSFQGENGYSVSGNVEIRPSSSSSGLELSFTNFNCQPGPALYIYMGNDVNGGIEIERLSQLNGRFIIQLPGNVQLNDYQYVLIWSKSVNAAYGSAQLN